MITNNVIHGRAPTIEPNKLSSYLGFSIGNDKYSKANNPDKKYFIKGNQKFSDFKKTNEFIPDLANITNLEDAIGYQDEDGDRLSQLQLLQDMKLTWFAISDDESEIPIPLGDIDNTACSFLYGRNYKSLKLAIEADIQVRSEYGVPNMPSSTISIYQNYEIELSGICGIAPKSLAWWDGDQTMQQNDSLVGNSGIDFMKGGGYGDDFNPLYGYLPSTELDHGLMAFPTTAFKGASFKVITLGSANNYNFIVDGSGYENNQPQDGIFIFNAIPERKTYTITVTMKSDNIEVGKHQFTPQKWYEAHPTVSENRSVAPSYIRIDFNDYSGHYITHQRNQINCSHLGGGGRLAQYSELIRHASIIDGYTQEKIQPESNLIVYESRTAGSGVFDEWGNFMSADALSMSNLDIYDVEFTKTYQIKNSHNVDLG